MKSYQNIISKSKTLFKHENKNNQNMGRQLKWKTNRGEGQRTSNEKKTF